MSKNNSSQLKNGNPTVIVMNIKKEQKLSQSIIDQARDEVMAEVGTDNIKQILPKLKDKIKPHKLPQSNATIWVSQQNIARDARNRRMTNKNCPMAPRLHFMAGPPPYKAKPSEFTWD